jgi:hypothetical protein
MTSFPDGYEYQSSSKRKVEVSSQGTFDRMVTAGKGFGSYCFGQNTLLLGILRGLKYRSAAMYSPPSPNHLHFLYAEYTDVGAATTELLLKTKGHLYWESCTT